MKTRHEQAFYWHIDNRIGFMVKGWHPVIHEVHKKNEVTKMSLSKCESILNEKNIEFTQKALGMIQERIDQKEWKKLFTIWGVDGLSLIKTITTTPQVEKWLVKTLIYEIGEQFYYGLNDDVSNKIYDFSRLVRDYYDGSTTLDYNWIKENCLPVRIKGVKVNKIMRNVMKYVIKEGFQFDQYRIERFNELIEELDNALADKPRTVQVTLSIDLYDWLRMSEGNSWTSCHKLEDGCHKSGTVSYAVDKYSALMYVESSDGKTLVSRRVVHLTHDGLIIGSTYGDSSNNNHFVAFFNELLGDVPVTQGYKSNVPANGTAYRDWYYCQEDNTHLKFETPYSDYDLEYGEKPLCVKCGHSHYESGFLVCDDCNNPQQYCPHCDIEVDEDKLIWIESSGQMACMHCASRCRECDEWTLDGDLIDAYNRIGRNILICPDCVENTYRECDVCGCLHHEDNMQYNDDDDCLCDDCYQESKEHDEEEHTLEERHGVL